MASILYSESVVLARASDRRIGALSIEPAACLLRASDGRTQVIEPRVMQVLVALARADGATVTRDELIAACWSGRIVSNDAVSRVISILRTMSLGIGSGSFTVETLNKIGYRLIEEPVSVIPDPAPPSIPAVSADPVLHSRRAMIALGGVAGAVAVGSTWLIRNGWSPSASIPREQALLALPFESDSKDFDLRAIAHDAAEAMRNDLGAVPGLRVLDALTGQSVAHDGLSPPQILSRTGATLLLMGSLDRIAGTLRLTLTMADTASRHQFWSSTIEAPVSQPLDLQRDAAGAVIEQLVLRLPASSRDPALDSQRGDPEAYRLSVDARALCDDVREYLLSGELDAAQDLADQAAALAAQSLRLAPENPGALVVMADLTRNGWSRTLAAMHLTTQQRVDHATLLLRRALRSDPTSAEAMARLADIYRRFSWRWDDAETLFRHALLNDPANAYAHWAYSHELATLGRVRDGLEHALTLWDIDRNHLWRRITLPRMLLFVGLRDQALTRYYRELRAAPGNAYLIYEIYYLNLAQGNSIGLTELLESLESLWRGRVMTDAVKRIVARCRAALDAIAGKPAALSAILDEELARFEAGGLSFATLGGRARDDLAFILAIEYAHTGAYAQAIALLDQALEAMSVYWLASLPYGDAPFPEAMRSNPRFQALWRRDPRMADAVERRRRAAASGQMAAFWPDRHATRGRITPALQARIDAAVAVALPKTAQTRA